jgi:hypothetical protein
VWKASSLCGSAQEQRSLHDGCVLSLRAAVLQQRLYLSNTDSGLQELNLHQAQRLPRRARGHWLGTYRPAC